MINANSNSTGHTIKLARARKQIRLDDGLIADLRKARLDSSVSRNELAFRMGITAKDVSDIEDGRVSPSLQDLRRYANALGRTITYQVNDGTGSSYNMNS